ncbi:hypothetical protein LEP1GSC047_3755 [Leptospira inadai serovar Lyme str. 10]|uniref:Uncharacterized protein n=1 Tax=Leptospira inadai serovar Lyme str. 10 TaxID=1049790 RepID=V6HL21_9LEPT|nr:hypothetical protein LEP1GSC047_3755 [Leptospira inadai serovar Lyme str. 10]
MYKTGTARDKRKIPTGTQIKSFAFKNFSIEFGYIIYRIEKDRKISGKLLI